MVHAHCAPSRTFYLCPITSQCISDQVTKCSDKICRSHDVFRTTYEMSDLIRIRIGSEGATDSSSIIRLVHFMPHFRHKNKYKISKNKNKNDSFNILNCCAFSSFFLYIFYRFPFSLISWGQHETRATTTRTLLTICTYNIVPVHPRLWPQRTMFILLSFTELGSSGENCDILCNFKRCNYFFINFLFMTFSSTYLLYAFSLLM